MITTRELDTVRAALRYWQEEMCPHGVEAMQPYFDQTHAESLSSGEIEKLRLRFSPANVRYGPLDAGEDRFATTELFPSVDAALQATERGDRVATVLLPISADVV